MHFLRCVHLFVKLCGNHLEQPLANGRQYGIIIDYRGVLLVANWNCLDFSETGLSRQARDTLIS